MVSYRSGLNQLLLCEAKSNFKFSDYTTYKLGGGADLAYFPKNIYQAKQAYLNCVRYGEKFCVLGRGSNVLASDKYYKGSVIITSKMRDIVRLSENKIFCLAGTSVGELIKYCVNKNLGGLEYLVGIPATVGGLAYMNGGVGSNYIGQNIESVLLFNGKTVRFSRENLVFEYKHSTMQDINAIILGVTINVYASKRQDIERNLHFFRQKRTHLPKGRSCGCVFKNPEGYSAGKLIDDCGLKGLRIGSAYVSPEHANFVICDGSSSGDVRALISAVKAEVFRKSGVVLCEEVVYIGDFYDSDC